MTLLKRVEQKKELSRVSLPTRSNYDDIKTRVQNRLLAELDPNMDTSNTVEVREKIEELFNKILDEEGIIL